MKGKRFFFVLFFVLFSISFVSAAKESCCVCRYQQNDPFSWLFRQQCHDWLNEPDQRSLCDHTAVLPVNFPLDATCKYELPQECRGVTGTLVDRYYGHFSSTDTVGYLDRLAQVCIDESCSVYSVNTGCLAMGPFRPGDSTQMAEFLQQHLNKKLLPPGVHFTFTGMQCDSAGGAGEEGGLFPCANAECTIRFGCEPEFVSCDRLGEGLCLDPGATVRCTNGMGQIEQRYCCPQGAIIPGFGSWRRGTSCDDLAQYPCLRGCCSCGTDPSTGQPCKYCQDTAQFGDNPFFPGSKASIQFHKYDEILECRDGQCRLKCIEDFQFLRENPPTKAVKTANCGSWVVSLPGDQSNGIKKDCSTGDFTYRIPWMDNHGWTDGSAYGGVRRGQTEGSCTPEDIAFAREAAKRLIPPTSEKSCNSYKYKEWCGNEVVTTVEITIATKNTDMCS